MMYADALDAGIVPVAATVLPYDRATPTATAAIFTLNNWIESFAKVLNIPWCDTARAAANPAAPHRLRGSPDGLHPDVDGYRRMGGGPPRWGWRPTSRHEKIASHSDFVWPWLTC